MRWTQFFTLTESMTAEEARKYIATHQEGAFTLLDVRQPKEYQQEHIPGSKLVPLPELGDRLDEFDPQKPIIVYCAVGGRSRVAAQMLAGKGFEKVYNLKGGIKAWQDQTAIGPVDMGIPVLEGNESPQDLITLAYGMEMELETFYREMAAKSTDNQIKDTFKRLVDFEKTHKTRLFSLYQEFDPSMTDQAAYEQQAKATLMEGGMTPEEFLQENAPAMQTAQDVVNVAMMIEAQSYDLYTRCTEHVRNTKSQSIFLQLASEEKAHLNQLGDLKNTLG